MLKLINLIILVFILNGCTQKNIFLSSNEKPLTKEEKIDEKFVEQFFQDLKEYNKKSNCSPYL